MPIACRSRRRRRRHWPKTDLLPVLLSGGDDYELLFTAGAGFTAPEAGTPVAEIGAVVSGSGVKVLDRDGAEIPLKVGGWQHF